MSDCVSSPGASANKRGRARATRPRKVAPQYAGLYGTMAESVPPAPHQETGGTSTQLSANRSTLVIIGTSDGLEIESDEMALKREVERDNVRGENLFEKEEKQPAMNWVFGRLMTSVKREEEGEYSSAATLALDERTSMKTRRG